MAIKCGHCRKTHETVAQVRLCSTKGETPAATQTGDFRPNKFAGNCVKCGVRVEAGQGRIDKVNGRWEVSHLFGQHQLSTKSQKAGATAPARRDFSEVKGGYYATVSATGANDFDFWYVKEGRKEGYRFVKRYLGGQGPIRISGGEAIRALEAILAEGVDKCGDRFADELGKCRDCGLPLTDETSRRERRGPICRAK